jgi:hypothetical protein
MVHIIKPEKSYIPENGDIAIYGKHHEYMEKIDMELFRNMNPMPLGGFSDNPWKALYNTGIDRDDIDKLIGWSINYCPCSCMEYYAIVPINILTSDATRYLGPEENKNKWMFYDMYNDAGWNRHMNWQIDNNDETSEIPEQNLDHHLSSVHRAILGSGYNEGILPTDGSHSLIFATIPLDNGDKIVIIGWEWHNK